MTSTSMAVERIKALLGVHPMRIMDDIYNCAHDYLCDGLDCLERSLLETLPDLSGEQAQQIVDLLQDQLTGRLDRNLDRMELYAFANVFCVPDGIDVQQPLPKPEEEERVELEELHRLEGEQDRRRAALQAKIQAAEAINANLQRELSLLDENKPSVEGMHKTVKSQIEDVVDIQRKVSSVSSSAATYIKRSAELQKSFNALQNIGVLQDAENVAPHLGGIELPLSKIVKFSDSTT